MKKLFSATLILIIAVASTHVIAQTSFSAESYLLKNDHTVAFSVMSFANSSTAHMKAIKDFIKKFDKVNDEKWYEVSDGFFASFKDDGIETKVAYHKNGIWDCTVRTLNESQMPFAVRDAVKKIYYDSRIIVVYEIKHSDNTAYIIKTEDDKTIKTLRVVDGDVEVISDYTRG